MNRKIPVGVQLYSVRTECAKNLPGVLDQVAKMGYQGVEFAGYYDHSAKDLRKMLDDRGLKCCGTHTMLDTMLGDKLQPTIEFNRILGNQYLIVPWMPKEQRNSIAAIQKSAETFNAIAEKLAPVGMKTGYHAHHDDFEIVDGISAWDRLFTATKASVLQQMDTGNCLQGGSDPIGPLKRYPGRSLTVHLKPFGGAPGAPIGQDTVPWAQVLETCQNTGGTLWYIVEHEDVTSPMQSIRQCLEALRGMGV